MQNVSYGPKKSCLCVCVCVRTGESELEVVSGAQRWQTGCDVTCHECIGLLTKGQNIQHPGEVTLDYVGLRLDSGCHLSEQRYSTTYWKIKYMTRIRHTVNA